MILTVIHCGYVVFEEHLASEHDDIVMLDVGLNTSFHCAARR